MSLRFLIISTKTYPDTRKCPGIHYYSAAASSAAACAAAWISEIFTLFKLCCYLVSSIADESDTFVPLTLNVLMPITVARLSMLFLFKFTLTVSALSSAMMSI